MYTYKRTLGQIALWLGLGLVLAACSSTQAINFKLHTDPEGSHVVYKISPSNTELPPQWIYLGVTPYKGVTLFDKKAFSSDTTISVKVMQNGYLDQVKEWNGEQFIDEFENQKMIFWTPHLVKSSD